MLIGGTITAWTYLARVALESGQVPLSVALNALDRGEAEQARSLVGRMLTSGLLPKSEYGGPLYVLGAIKTYDAEMEPSPEKRRVDYLVASRYLKEARSYGFPPGRENAARFLLGKSLLESNQYDEGLDILDELLAAGGEQPSAMTTAIHRLLAHACLWMPKPQLDKSLEHSELALADPELAGDNKTLLMIDRGLCLSRLERFADANATLNAVDDVGKLRTNVLFARAQIALDELNVALRETAKTEQDQLIQRSIAKIDSSLQGIDETQVASEEDGRFVWRIGFLRGESLRLKGDVDGAVAAFANVRQFDEEGPEGLAAALREADLLRARGNYSGALFSYRRVLEGVDPETYHGYVLSLNQIRELMLAALLDYVNQKRYDDARVILGRLSPLFNRTEVLKLRAETFQRWGDTILSEKSAGDWQVAKERQHGLGLLREAGLAYEQLAELRFATEHFSGDLWAAAESYYRGHSFSRATAVLNKFLDYEPELRNALALLRLGQCQLALGNIPECVAALEECIDFHPQDSATYEARIDCAKAYWCQGNYDQAEKLLRDNIAGSKLKPSSREWKDSLFELGMLQYDKGSHKQAIDTLEIAIERYPDDAQTLLAQYIVGVSYRRWAEELQEQSAAARTTTEREKGQQVSKERLELALGHLLAVQRRITLSGQDLHRDAKLAAMLRNCYMLAGAVLFDLGRFNEAINAYSNVSSLYPNDPFVLETFVQIANCYRRLGQNDKARGAVQQAQIAYEGLPADAEFTESTALNRDEWRLLLADMAKW
jgi:tetratricopeptide (TPR) repeat protein